MRKLLFLIPLIIVFVSACADIDQTQSKKYTEDNSTNQPVNPGGNNGGQTNPDGDGNDNGTTTDPENPADKPGYDTTFNAKTDVFQPQFYYGRSLLSEEEQKAYDLLMKTFVEFEVTDANKNNTRNWCKF